MKNCKEVFTSKTVIGIAAFSAALLLNAPAAKAGTTADPASLSLPPAYSWSAANDASGVTSGDAAAALQSLDTAQTYSPLYNPAWFYDLEISSGKNLTPPSGGSTGSGQTGSTTPVIETLPAAPLSASVDPLQSLADAEANSSSYSATWVADTERFLNRDSSGGDTTPTDVPEPGSLPVLLTGILGLGLIRLRKTSKKTS